MPGPEPRPRILLADDDARLCASVRAVLELAGYRVDTVADGGQALIALRRQSFDLLLLDINMPVLTGQQLLDRLAGEAIDTSVIVLSGESTFDQATRAFRKGVVDFLAKPCPPPRLLDSVAAALQRRLQRQESLCLQRRLQRSEELHRFLINCVPDLFFLLDDRGIFLFVGDRAEGLLGWPAEALLGRHFSSLVYARDRKKARHAFEQVRQGGLRSARRLELRLNMRASADVCHVEVQAGVTLLPPEAATAEDAGSGIGVTSVIYGVARDIGERKQSQALQRHHRYHDLLTQLPNGLLFDDRLEMALSQMRRGGGRLALMSLDLDRFKKVNDSLGRLAGDTLLQAIALRLKKSLREGDTLARIGGDEFLLLLPGLVLADEAVQIAEKVLALARQPLHYQQQAVRLTFSIGIALYPDHGQTKQALLRHADLALERCKARGRNSFCFYSAELQRAGAATLSLENDLAQAVARDQLRLHYQPQIAMETGQLVGLEALLRWQHPRLGLLAPAAFIVLAEEAHLMADLGDWVLEQACRDAAVLRQRDLEHVKIAINVSPQQFQQAGFARRMLARIAAAGLSPRQFEVEIVETSLMRDMKTTQSLLATLAEAGVAIAVDDFGTGYSSLGYLQSLPLHTLKLDRCFVRPISQSGSISPIVRAVLAMARGLELDCVAEGVESPIQHQVLREAGCRIGQGYHYSRPLTFDVLLASLQLRAAGAVLTPTSSHPHPN